MKCSVVEPSSHKPQLGKNRHNWPNVTWLKIFSGVRGGDDGVRGGDNGKGGKDGGGGL